MPFNMPNFSNFGLGGGTMGASAPAAGPAPMSPAAPAQAAMSPINNAFSSAFGANQSNPMQSAFGGAFQTPQAPAQPAQGSFDSWMQNLQAQSQAHQAQMQNWFQQQRLQGIPTTPTGSSYGQMPQGVPFGNFFAGERLKHAGVIDHLTPGTDYVSQWNSYISDNPPQGLLGSNGSGQ